MAYTATIVTENLFYPLALVFAWTLVRVLERPSAWRIALLWRRSSRRCATRSQALGFVAAVVLAPLVLAAVAARTRASCAGSCRCIGGLVGLAVLVVVVQLARGRSTLSDLLGAYSVVGEGGYDAR